MAVAIIISTFGCNNGLILAGSRVAYAMAKDGLFFRATGKLNSRAVPRNRAGLPRRLDYRVAAASHAQTGRHVRQPLQRSSKLRGLRPFWIFYVLTIAGLPSSWRRNRPDAGASVPRVRLSGAADSVHRPRRSRLCLFLILYQTQNRVARPAHRVARRAGLPALVAQEFHELRIIL